MGVLVALTLQTLVDQNLITLEAEYRVWPTSIVMMTDAPTSLKLLIGYGGNFLAYGFAAYMGSLTFYTIRDFVDRWR